MPTSAAPPAPKPAPPAPPKAPPLERTVAGARRWVRDDARFDVPASLVVFLVAVPLSLGIAVASDAPVAAGLIAAAVGGILAGLIGGAPLQVSGPAAGLTVVVAETVAQFGWEATCAITAMAGLLQVVLGTTRLGRFAMAISPTVVAAMLAGIGVSIVLGQANVALGGSSQPSAWGNVSELASSAASLQVHALVAALLVIGVLVAWPRLPQRVRVVPGPLVAVVLVTLVAAAVLPDATRVDLGGDVLDQVGTLAFPEGTPLAIGGAVLTVALIASVESLLSAVATDKMHDGPRARLDRELVGQGVANTASGALGGLPVTGVIVRSTANITSGARTRASAVLHGVWVAIFALLLVAVVEQVPLAALAGLLVMMGIGLVKPAEIRRSRARGELWIYLLTIATVLALNLIEGVLIGLVAALALVLWRTARVDIDAVRRGTAPDGRELWVVEVRGSLSFLAAPALVRRLASIPDGQVVELDLLVDYLDPAGTDQIEEWARRYREAGGEVVVEHSGPAGPVGGDGSDDESADERAAKADPVSPRTLLPWNRWQNGSAELGTDGVPAHPLAVGLREYHRRHLDTLGDVWPELADGQSPRVAFLGCVDSRVVPNVLTSSGPGDLFTVRTMGNLVPEPGTGDGSVAAPLLYAVDHLGVDTVVVCGHSGCGAMAAAHGVASGDDDVAHWLAHADASLEAWRAGHAVGSAAVAAELPESDQLGQVNVAVGVERVRALLGPDRASVAVVGLWLSVGDGVVSHLHDDGFAPLTDAELTALAHLGDVARTP